MANNQKMPDTLPCIKCGRALRNVFAQTENQPDDGLAARTRGHYGSTVFDPDDGSYLEFNICDPCLVKAGAAGHVLYGRSPKPLVRWHKDLA